MNPEIRAFSSESLPRTRSGVETGSRQENASSQESRAPFRSYRNGKGSRAFSSEVETGSRQENASNQESRVPFRSYRNGKGSSVWPAIVIAIAIVAGVAPVRAQDYPSRSITVIVPF